jgi:hypothetical protein
VPPVKAIVVVPEVAPLIVNPPTVKVFEVIVVAAETVNVPVIVQLPDNVLVLAPENVTLPGNVLPPLVIVLAADIVIAPVPVTVQLCAVLSVKLPATVKVTAVFIVIVEVYPEVNVKERIVILTDTIDVVLPFAPPPSKVTSSDTPGTEELSAVPDELPQFVGAVTFQV